MLGMKIFPAQLGQSGGEGCSDSVGQYRGREILAIATREKREIKKSTAQHRERTIVASRGNKGAREREGGPRGILSYREGMGWRGV